MSNEKNQSIGGMWKNTSQNGEYFNINIEIDGKQHKLIAFNNKFKNENSKSPDFKVYVSKPKTSLQEAIDNKAPVIKKNDSFNMNAPFTEDDLPF